MKASLFTFATTAGLNFRKASTMFEVRRVALGLMGAAALAVGTSVQAAIIVTTDSADARIESSGPTVNEAGTSLTVGRIGTGNDGTAILPFLLPSLGAGESFSDVIFSAYKSDNNSEVVVELHLLDRSNSSPTALVSDFFIGTSEPTDATVIETAFGTGNGSSTGQGTLKTSTSGSALATAINDLITAGATPGTDYVFIRLSRASGGGRHAYRSSEYDPDGDGTAYAPGDSAAKLAFTVIPEPSALAAVSLLSPLALRRRRSA